MRNVKINVTSIIKSEIHSLLLHLFRACQQGGWSNDLSAPHLLAIDLQQVKVVEAVDDEGAPQSQTDHGVSLRVNGQLIQTPHLSQGCQLRQTADVGFQEDQVLWKKQQVSFGVAEQQEIVPFVFIVWVDHGTDCHSESLKSWMLLNCEGLWKNAHLITCYISFQIHYYFYYS